MKQLLFFIFLVLVGISMSLQAQNADTIKLMTYNTTNYGFPATGSCPLLDPTLKHPYMRTVIAYENPDILGFVKMAASPSSFSTDTVISEVLDSVCAGCWGHSPFTNQSNYVKENMLYFKTAKFGFINTTTIYSGDSNISDINLHRLYYKDTSLATTHDTAFINIIQCHDKSGNDPTDSAERAADLAGAMIWMASHVTAQGNYIFMGDLNTQSSAEGCLQNLLAATDTNIRFIDPSGQVGNWSHNPSGYALYLNQSTRSTDPGDCGSTGGLNEIFDHILCTSPVMQGSQRVKYVTGSYTTVGQDGHHTNAALTDAPSNSVYPFNLVKALYNMSSHLPVTVLMTISRPDTIPVVQTGVSDLKTVTTSFICDNTATDILHVKATSGLDGVFQAMIYDITGRLIAEDKIYNNQNNFLPISGLAYGSYILVISHSDGIVYTHRFSKTGM